jgi:copper chaperone CopZ
MNTLQFKTNINCGNCIKSVTPFLNALETVDRWQVNTDVSDKILSVETEESEAMVRQQVEKAVQDAGFRIESI